MAVNVYDIGDRIRLGNHSATAAASFKDSTGAAADPDGTITIMVRDPENTVVTYTYGGSPALAKETTGRYYVDYDLDVTALVGFYFYRLAGTGSNVMASEEGSFEVRPSLVLS
jgi:hypothetical protein